MTSLCSRVKALIRERTPKRGTGSAYLCVYSILVRDQFYYSNNVPTCVSAQTFGHHWENNILLHFGLTVSQKKKREKRISTFMDLTVHASSTYLFHELEHFKKSTLLTVKNPK